MLGLWWGLIEAKQWLVSTPHRTVRIAPALIGQKSPHHHNFRTFFEHYFRQVYLVVQYIFLQSKKKNIFEPYFSIFEEEYTT